MFASVSFRSSPSSSSTSLHSEDDRRRFRFAPYTKPAPKTPRRVGSSLTIDVNGKPLNTTPVFSLFWKWCSERHCIYLNRRARKPYPWTSDPILQTYAFCNTFRVLDRTSQFLVKHVVQTGSQHPRQLLFRILLFFIFNNISTYRSLQRSLGPLTWESYQRSKYDKVLFRIKDSGKPLYNPAYMFIYANRPEGVENFQCHLDMLESWMNDDSLLTVIQEAEYLGDIYDHIKQTRGMGPFMSYQLLIALSYSSLITFSNNDFVKAGLGAESGLLKLFGKSVKQQASRDPSFVSEVLRHLQENQAEYFDMYGLEPPLLGPERLPMSIVDIEHAVCEVDKYARISHPNIKGGSLTGAGGSQGAARTTIKKVFNYHKAEPLPPMVLPEAWSMESRKVVNVRPEPYIVQNIMDWKQDDYGQILYYVSWEGYPDDEDSWEPEDNLDNCQELLKKFKTKHGIL